MSLPAFRLLRPRKVEQAVELLAKHAANIQVLAGGTDLIPSLRQKLFEPKYVLDIRGLGELRGIRQSGEDGVEIGALTTLTEIERSFFLREHYSVLREAAPAAGSRPRPPTR